MEPVRLGIIGCGVISASHLRLAAQCPDVKVVAVADLIRKRARAQAETFGVPTVYVQDEDLLRDSRVEAVVLAMPAGVRTPVAYKALKRGKHVLIEKPIASHAAEVRRMIALRGDRVVGCCSCRMTFTDYAAVAAGCVASGALGDIRVARIRAILPAAAAPMKTPPPWRQSMALNGGGILVNWSCYDLDFLMHIMGWRLKPRQVLAAWWPPARAMAAYAAPGSDADAHYTALIRCEGGAVLSMERAEMSAASGDQAWEIIGSKGTLHMPLLSSTTNPGAVVLDRFIRGKGVVSETLWQGPPKAPPVENEITDFVRAIRRHRSPRTSLEQALVMQQITDAIYASATRKAGVSIRS
jgi:predicted dehydrogenase